MNGPGKKSGADLSEELDRFKTPECIPLSVLGEYIEQKLRGLDSDRVEHHLRSCPHCLNQLVELKDLLFLENNADPLPADLEKRIQDSVSKQNGKSSAHISSISEKFMPRWISTFSWQGVTALAAVVILVVYLGFQSFSTTEPVAKAPATPIEMEAVVQVDSQSDAAPKSAVPVLPQEIPTALSGIQIDANVPRIAATLENLGKNLILESTRGEKNIAVFEKASSAVVYVISGKDRSGSGVLITSDGQVLTNWHVVGDDPKVVVFLKPKNSAELMRELAFVALVEKTDQVTDLALLRIVSPPRNLTFVPLGASSSLKVGQDVHAIGHPLGEVWTYTRGIISQLRGNYDWKTAGGAHRANVIQTQTPINPGNSGGPLLDNDARLVGINSFRHPSGEGINYAVAVDTVNEFLSRSTSRAATRRAAPSGPQIKCSERYDTLRRGWDDIIGCFQDSVAPPPDVWLVYREQTKYPAYVAMDSDTSGKSSKIDLVKIGLDSQWKSTELYVDSNCDGTVDLIMSTKEGSNQPSSSRLPPANLRLIDLAKEVNTAIKSGQIPYPKLRVCQK